MAFSLLAVVVCVGIILLGLFIFIGVIIKASKGKSSCGDCKKCSEEFCAQRREDYKKK